MLSFSVCGVLRIIDITAQEVRKVEQSGPGTGQRPDFVLIVQFAKESELAPLLFDLVVRHDGARLLSRLLAAPVYVQTTRDQYCYER